MAKFVQTIPPYAWIQGPADLEIFLAANQITPVEWDSEQPLAVRVLKPVLWAELRAWRNTHGKEQGNG